MPPSPTRRLSRRYAIGLLLMAGTIVAGQYVVQRSLARAAPDSRVLTRLGRQETLCQRITAITARLPELEGAARERAMDDLNQSMLEFRATYEQLTRAEPVPGLSSETSPAVAHRLEALAPAHATILREAGAVLRLASDRAPPEPARLATLAEQSEQFLEGMDLTLRTYEAGAISRLGRARAVAAGLSALTLLVLIAESLLVFQPALGALRAYLREQRRLLDDAEEAASFKGRFLATMSHELRTPLAAVVGYAHLLEDERLADGRRREYAAGALRSAEHLLALVNGTLDLSKIEAGRFSLVQDDVELTALLDRVVSVVRPLAHGKGLLFRTRAETPVPRTLRTDAVRLGQVLLNLLGNAVQYTSEGEVELRIRASEAEVSFLITDTGPGIPADRLAGVFAPFERGAPDAHGAGLGLHIASTLAERLGARIEVRSELERGSVFELVLPREGDSDLVAGDRVFAPQPSMNTAHRSLRGAHILVADDHPDQRVIVRALLEREGARVTEAADGDATVARAKEAITTGERLDAVLLDIQMPGMDGLAAIRAMREAGFDGLVIALTAQATEEDRQQCLEAGFDDHLAKPIAPAALFAAITRGKRAGTQPTTPSTPAPTATDLRDRLPPQVVLKFREQLGDRLGAMEQALDREQWDELAALAHMLKGTAPSFGLAEAGRAAAELEQAARLGDVVRARAAFRTLRAAAN